MTASERLSRFLPPRVAAVVAGLWYAALVTLTLMLSGLPAGRFVYDAL
jgi:hypothetical protein